jgi:choline dehydrogenase
VRADLTVDRVLLRDGRATGVVAGGEVIAAREVILAAGTPLTPALLLRSGIGPSDDLRWAGVPSVVDLPGVGRGLYDQPGAVIPALPVPGAIPAGAPVTQVIARLSQIPGHPPDDGFYLCLFAGPEPGGSDPMTTIMIGDLNPVSRGAITLAGPSPHEPPDVNLSFYTAPGDIERMRAAYRHGWSIAQHPAFAKTVSGFVMVTDDVVASDERLDELLRGMTFSRLTLLGGAAMGPQGEPSAVVGDDCRVHGVEGLRVADLSIVPVPLRSPTALDAMMLGEHAAHLIAPT